MKRKTVRIAAILLIFILCAGVTAFAVSESDVQNAVNAGSKESVSGNLFIWFLCAIAFLKISQKIDSFMSSLGISVGKTGGSMIGDLMVAAKGVKAAASLGGKFSGFGGRGGSNVQPAGGGFFGGIGRKVAGGAASAASGTGGAGGIMSAIGKKMYGSSLEGGGKFATEVISSIARGNRAQMGSITGSNAKSAMESYFGFNKTSTVKGGTENSSKTSFSSDVSVTGKVDNPPPQFSDVEMGGGRITGTETTEKHPDGIGFAMYDAEKYDKPDGKFEVATAVDGSKWYKQYAEPTVEKTPYMGTEGKVKYNEKIVSKLPKAPVRKDKV